METKKGIAKVCSNIASGQKWVTIPQKIDIQANEYIIYEKIEFPKDLAREKIQKIISLIEQSDVISFITKDGEVIPIL